MVWEWGAWLGAGPKQGGNIQGEVDDGFLPAEESEARNSQYPNRSYDGKEGIGIL